MSYGTPPPPPPGYGGPPYGQYGPYGQPTAGTNQKAVWSLVLGIASVVLCSFGLLAGVPAAILGVAARREVSSTGQGGDGIAIAGIVLGAIGAAISVLTIIAVVVLAFADSAPS